MGGGLADRSIISRLSVKVRKARARDVGDYTTYSLERRKEGGTALCIPVFISNTLKAYINRMADISGK